MPFDNLVVDVLDRVATVTIHRPDALNALNRATLAELDQAFGTLTEDPSVRTIVLTGSGAKAFVAGADINEIHTLTAVQARAFAEYGQGVFNRIEQCPKPVIAAVNGYALGGGLELALACHLRLAADSAKLGLPEIKLGVIPGFGGTQRLPRLIGQPKALQLMLTGNPVDAQQAQNLGLVNQVVPADQLIEVARTLAATLAQQPAESVRGILQLVLMGLEAPIEHGLALEAARFAMCCATDDMREGTRAFLEKRPASFKDQ
ncbi:MAG: enoyl-CoA hydratase-related protein [Pseudomonadota bacterium]